jgi:hypothetical protein
LPSRDSTIGPKQWQKRINRFECHGGTTIVNAAAHGRPAQGSILALAFAAGTRPDPQAVLAQGNDDAIGSRFGASHLPDPSEGWVELLASGLTFDCRGLSPSRSEPLPTYDALLGLEAHPDGEAIALAPGPHLAEAAGMLPVIKVLAGIGATLARLPGCKAVAWRPARCWMPSAYFGKVIGNWLAGGPFPALGLTSLQRETDGSMQTVGLSLLTGQELVFAPDRALGPADMARIAVRLIHALIEVEPLVGAHQFTGPDGEPIDVVPVRDGRQLRVSVRR